MKEVKEEELFTLKSMAIYLWMKIALLKPMEVMLQPYTGGAGSGGSICLAIKGEVKFDNDNTAFCAKAMGGDHIEATHPSAQGKGGTGCITIYLNATTHR